MGRRGRAWLGKAGRVKAGRGMERQGKGCIEVSGPVPLVAFDGVLRAGHGQAWQGKVRHGMARHG